MSGYKDNGKDSEEYDIPYTAMNTGYVTTWCKFCDRKERLSEDTLEVRVDDGLRDYCSEACKEIDEIYYKIGELVASGKLAEAECVVLTRATEIIADLLYERRTK
jgi:hypothetical protein